MTIDLKDLLIEKPVTLCYWKLAENWQVLKDYFERETEFKLISTPEEISSWITATDVHNIIIGLEDPKTIKEISPHIEAIPLEKRRKIFLLLVSIGVTTLDPKEAFLYSVNLVLNPADVKELERIYLKCKRYWESLYRGFNGVYQKVMEVIL
ncbi:MAG: hypothetical protein N2327_04170 [Caldimicrobium sp.]|nr:hypothetical protein [Caldimicrobium sp.]MCX7873612.1 hypothetical protein [Caldimicrobium sp.]MDW8094416.1 hypothetical protein [Caldimicrobium sp.]